MVGEHRFTISALPTEGRGVFWVRLPEDQSQWATILAAEDRRAVKSPARCGEPCGSEQRAVCRSDRVRRDYMPASSSAFAALVVLVLTEGFASVFSPPLLFVLLPVLAVLLLGAALSAVLAELFVAAVLAVDLLDEDLASERGFGVDFDFSVFLAAEVLVVGLVAVLEREFFAASADRLSVFSGAAFSGAVSGGDLIAAALVAAAAFVAAGAAGCDLALTGPDMVMTAVVMVTTRAMESRTTRFMGVFFLEQADTTGRLFRNPLNAV